MAKAWTMIWQIRIIGSNQCKGVRRDRNGRFTASRRLHAMDKNELATKLLIFLASGGTVERLMAEVPLSKARIDSAFDWLKTGGRCSASEVVTRANQLREFVMQKRDALERKDFELAGRMRAHERAVFESF